MTESYLREQETLWKTGMLNCGLYSHINLLILASSWKYTTYLIKATRKNNNYRTE